MELDLKKTLEALLLSTAEPIALKNVVKLFVRYHQEIVEAAEGEDEDPAEGEGEDRPSSPKRVTEAQILEALRPIILANNPAVNSLGAVLAAANISGELPPDKCPAVTPELQIAVKTVSALHAFVNRHSFAGRFGTVWKVGMSIPVVTILETQSPSSRQ